MKKLRIIILHWLFPTSCYCPVCWCHFPDESFYHEHYKVMHPQGKTRSGRDIISIPVNSNLIDGI